jgi:hypothetical protein
LNWVIFAGTDRGFVRCKMTAAGGQPRASVFKFNEEE